MLRNVLIMASSGIVLFSKEFVNTIAQPRLVGSLITAMLEFSTKTTGAPVSYIELANVAVTIVTNDASKVFCAMFHDTTDGYTFSSFIAREILEAFIQEYAADLGNIGHNLRDFHRFHYRISEVIRESVKPILLKLQQQRGIMKAIFVLDDSVSYATVDVDQLGVLANLQSLINLSSDMMAYVGESVKSVTIQSSRNTCTQVSTIENGTLIVMYKKGAHAQKNMIAIKDTADMLRRGIYLAYPHLPYSRIKCYMFSMSIDEKSTSNITIASQTDQNDSDFNSITCIYRGHQNTNNNKSILQV